MVASPNHGTSAAAKRAIRAALYTHVSTRAQADKHGSAFQREALVRKAEARGWQIARVYTWNRPRRRRAFRRVGGGVVEVLASLSRTVSV